MIFYDLKQHAGLAPSLATHVAKEIGKKIISSTYAPGDLIEDETALANHYAVSRSVIRDAVKILVGKGLLEVRRGIGTKVRARQNWGILDDDVLAWFQSTPPNAQFLNQLMDIRRIFEPKAARWAAERGSEEDHNRIRNAIERMEANEGFGEEFVVADAAFHRSILRATKNEFLIALEGVIFSALLSSIRLTNKNEHANNTSVPFHRDVFDAIAKRDGEEAENLMNRLLEDTDSRLEARALKQ